MTPTMLRQFWTLVEHTQSNVLLGLDDSTLVQWLLSQLHRQQQLDGSQTDIFSSYIRSKLPLIRDIAQERQSFSLGHYH